MNNFIVLTLKLIVVAVEFLNAFLTLRKYACVSSPFRNEGKEKIKQKNLGLKDLCIIL